MTNTQQKRNGQALSKLPRGDKRRISDGRNAWRKMTPQQRAEFVQWVKSEDLAVARDLVKATKR